MPKHISAILNKNNITIVVLTLCTVIMAVTGYGFVKFETFDLTLFLIPITLGIVLTKGWPAVIFALIFGISSMTNGVEGLNVLFADPRIAIIPRVLSALATWGIFVILHKCLNDGTKSADFVVGGITAAFMVFLHSSMVMTALSLLYPDTFGVPEESRTFFEQSAAITTALIPNIIYELIITTFVTLISIALYQIWDKREKSLVSIRKSMQKWIALSLYVTGNLTFIACMSIDTFLENNQSDETLEIALTDLKRDFFKMRDKVPYSEILYRVGQSGHMIIVKDKSIVAADGSLSSDVNFADLGISHIRMNTMFLAHFKGLDWRCKAVDLDDLILIGMLPDSEIHIHRNHTAVQIAIALVLIVAVVYILLSMMIKNNLIDNVSRICKDLSKISNGELGTRVNVQTNLEFSLISQDINKAVQALQEAKAEVERRINGEMELAGAIQNAVLPARIRVWPECEIAASIVPAREVGGDFYDYFELPNHRLGLLIADVSGKGIPAAMFMMTAKILIKNLVYSENSPARILEKANKQIFDTNDAGMFVTVWLGILDLDNGMLTFANAGHNPPILQSGASQTFLDHKKFKRGLMIGARANVKYEDNTISLKSGDQILLYTDGITEASNMQKKLYGNEKLAEIFNEYSNEEPMDILNGISEDVNKYEGESGQSDDKTMLVLRMYLNTKTLALDPDSNGISQMSDFIEDMVACGEIPDKILHQLLISADEIISNIVKYSGAERIDVTCRLTKDFFRLTFSDDGSPFNPLDNPDPDTTLALEERGEGGYGIFIVRKLMDKVSYKYLERHNILNLEKTITIKS